MVTKTWCLPQTEVLEMVAIRGVSTKIRLLPLGALNYLRYYDIIHFLISKSNRY